MAHMLLSGEFFSRSIVTWILRSPWLKRISRAILAAKCDLWRCANANVATFIPTWSTGKIVLNDSNHPSSLLWRHLFVPTWTRKAFVYSSWNSQNVVLCEKAMFSPSMNRYPVLISSQPGPRTDASRAVCSFPIRFYPNCPS